jgi:hypothetical protein
VNFRINTDKTAAVASDTYWLPMDCCPKGVKLLALSTHGVARIDIFSGQRDIVAWFPLPRIPPEMKPV